MNELQILRDEVDVDQPAGGELEVPDVALALFLRDGPPHVGDVAGGQVPGNRLDWRLGGREADALYAGSGHTLEALERQREVRAAARADHRMNLVDDDGAHRAQHLSAAFGGEEQVERLRCRDQDMRRRAQHRGAFGRAGVAGSHRGGEGRRPQPRGLRSP